ncbi:MAG TPA: hypothetical protein VHM48_10105 [Candidatus Limnocylindrales bacterium]|nr:hypothetical protein [Candidatus Limnocylindrales bacterium]
MSRPLPPRPTGPRPVAAATPELPPRRAVPAVERKARPDPGPLRLAFGLTGMAAATALLSAFLVPATSADAGAGTTNLVTVADGPTPSVQHVTRYVQLQPGQTAPPHAVVNQAPTPKPRIVVVTTRQSGAKP